MLKKYTDKVRLLVIGLPVAEQEAVVHGLDDFSVETTLTVYPDCQQATQQMRKSEQSYDVALVCADAIYKDGSEACLQELRRERTTPVILLDPNPSRERAQAAFRFGIQDYIEVDDDGRYLVYLPHTIVRIIDHYQAKWARQSAERTMERMAVSITAVSGRAFFHELTHYICESLNLDCALIAEVAGTSDSRKLHVLSYSQGDSIDAPQHFDVELDVSPCKQILDGEPVTINDGICPRYPFDKQLAAIGAESFIGLPLFNTSRQVTGVLAIAHRQPIENLDFVKLALRAFAARSEMELEREHTQEALQRQARILEQLGEAIVGADIDGNIKSWNHRAESLFGLKASQAIGRSIVSLLPDHDTDFVNHHLLEPLLIHGGHVVETPLLHDNGRMFHGHLSLSQEKNQRGEVVGIIACCRDVSARMNAEQERQEAQQRLHFHVQRTPLAFIEWDTNCNVTSWNPAAERIFGYTAKEIIGKPFSWLVHENDAQATHIILGQLLANTGGFSSTNDNITRDGRVITCEWYNTPLVNEEGKIIGIASLVNDITDRIRYEHELKKSKEAADTANRSKDEFLAVMSHEIRTPMNSIIGFADLLREQTNDEDQLESIDIIKANAYTLLELINNVLNYSRLDSGRVVLESRDTDIPLLISEVQEAMAAEANQKGLTLSCDIEEHTPPLVKTDYLELRQILLNVVGNAIKFTQEGSIHIALSAKPFTKKVNRWTYIFAVRDTGVGIPRDKLDTLFKSFSQVDSSSTRRFGGTGLGLAICRKICHLLGGNIWAESHEGRGTTVYFTIEGDIIESHPGQALSGQEHETTEALRILLVEDEAQTRQLLQEILKQMGHHCETASSGHEALGCLRKANFDIVFMDVEMEGMNGLEATQRIRQGEAGDANTTTFICALTAYTHGDDKETCLNAGMNEHLGKPILAKNLKSVLAKVKQPSVNPCSTPQPETTRERLNHRTRDRPR